MTGTLRHGYTIGDLQRLARDAAISAGMTSTSMTDRYDTAMSGICEALYEAENPPPQGRLIAAGRAAIWGEAKAVLRHHGWTTDGGTDSAARYAAYWLWAARSTPSPEHRVVERIALAQILPMLTAGQREAVYALAVAGDYRRAADALAARYRTYAGNLGDARRRFLRWWHEGETPSRLWMSDHRNGGDDARSGRRAMKHLRARTGSRINRPPSADLVPVEAGARCGSLTVLEGRRRGAIKILCRCDCGTVRPFLIANLRRGGTQSCGCPQGRAAAAERNRASRGVVAGGGGYPRTRSAARAADRRARQELHQ